MSPIRREILILALGTSIGAYAIIILMGLIMRLLVL